MGVSKVQGSKNYRSSLYVLVVKQQKPRSVWIGV